MSKPKTHPGITSDDIRRFLAGVDSDGLIAATSRYRGIDTPEDAEASKKIYNWLRHYARYLEETSGGRVLMNGSQRDA